MPLQDESCSVLLDSLNSVGEGGWEGFLETGALHKDVVDK